MNKKQRQKHNKKEMVIDMNELQLKAKPYQIPSFRTGKYLTEKDRPRQRRWDHWEE